MASGILPWIGKEVVDPLKRNASQIIQGGSQALAPVVGNLEKPLPGGGEVKDIASALYHPDIPQQTKNPTPVDPSFQKQLTKVAPAAPEPLSYQALMTKALEPMIKSLGTNPQTTAAGINSALGQYKSGTPQSLQNTIASTLHTTISDWQGGLQSMLNNIGTTTPAEALLSGMSSTLSYPTSTTLTGTEGAPAAVANSNELLALYQQLLAERNGQSPTSTSTPSALNGLLAGY